MVGCKRTIIKLSVRIVPGYYRYLAVRSYVKASEGFEVPLDFMAAINDNILPPKELTL